MKKPLLFLLVVVLFFGNTSIAQLTEKKLPNIITTHEYYLYIKGVNAKSDVKLLEKTIGQQKGVTYFMANRFPVRYFLLKSDRVIDKEEFASWITSGGYTLTSFGEGARALEQILTDRKKVQ